MGMEDRDWYREKRIDWNRGGLRDRNKEGRRFPKFAWWIVAAAVVLIVSFWLLRPV